MPETFTDDFAGAAGPLAGRVSPSGHTWSDYNGAANIDGDGHMIRNPAHEGLSGSAYGVYPAVSLAEPVKQMSAVVSWIEAAPGASDIVNENGALVLICALSDTRAGTPADPTRIFADCIHCVFGPWQTVIDIFQAGVKVEGRSRNWGTYSGAPLPVDGTPHNVGLIFDGNRIGVQLPDRANPEWVGDALYGTTPGRHMIWQSYNTTAPDLRPRFDSVTATSEPYAIPRDRGVAPGWGVPNTTLSLAVPL